MLLVGKIDVENKTQVSEGVTVPIRLSFTLPRRLRKRAILKVKYFGFHSGTYEEDTNSHNLRFYSANKTATNAKRFLFRNSPAEVRLSFRAEGEDIMNDNVGVLRLDRASDTVDMHDTQGINFIPFRRSKMCEALYREGGVKVENGAFDGNPSVGLCGHDELTNLHVGHLEEGVSQIEVIFDVIGAQRVRIDPEHTIYMSPDPNIRMDSMTLMMELDLD